MTLETVYGFSLQQGIRAEALVDMKLHLAGGRKIDADAFERETLAESGRWHPVVKASLHLPTPDMKLPARPTLQAGPISLPLARKRPAHFLVPATKQTG
jgi:hypothetical protein